MITVKILVGLGNPGSQYQRTRHNIGFRFVETIAEREGVQFVASLRFRAEIATVHSGGDKILLVKPQTFMNNSGESLAPLLQFYQAATADLCVLFDDLDLPAGKIRLRKGGGHGGHNGLRSLHQHLPDSDYYRIKVGIGRPPHGNITGWVLGQADEADRASEAVAFTAIEQQLDCILHGDLATASNAIHAAVD
ncbi:MAG: aminoacyl-tRNA hydrolase [Mariprofundaceae bacterium]|nr:aminoacyl-tRNA hydrolase [Mariprofundaceae bacterium]